MYGLVAQFGRAVVCTPSGVYTFSCRFKSCLDQNNSNVFTPAKEVLYSESFGTRNK